MTKMNILLINQSWFAPEFTALGHRVVSFGRAEGLDVSQQKLLISWSEIKAALPEDFQPDLLIIHDNSIPVLITELETIDIPCAFYSVDTHHHLGFHRYLSLVFPNIFVAQQDYIGQFAEFGVVPHWLPLWASVYLEPQSEKKHDAVFIGTLNPDLNPDRVAFFRELQKLVKIDVRTAAFTDIFPASRIVVNQTVKGDLNFRVFEAMMSGALLLTERTGNGLTDLFEDGKHLVLYTKGDVEDAARKIRFYLENPDKAQAIAEAGRKLVCEKHLALHRAQYVLDKISQPTRPSKMPHSFAAIQNFGALIGTLGKVGDKLWRARAALEILRITQIGLKSSDRLDPVLAFDIVRALLLLDMILSTESLQQILDDLRSVYPEMPIFNLVKIDQLVSNGKQDLAVELSVSLYSTPAPEVIKQAADIVVELRK